MPRRPGGARWVPGGGPGPCTGARGTPPGIAALPLTCAVVSGSDKMAFLLLFIIDPPAPP